MNRDIHIAKLLYASAYLIIKKNKMPTKKRWLKFIYKQVYNPK